MIDCKNCREFDTCTMKKTSKKRYCSAYKEIGCDYCNGEALLPIQVGFIEEAHIDVWEHFKYCPYCGKELESEE